MKIFVKALVVCALVVLVSWAMVFISSDENSIKLNSDWGIAKDKPLR